MAKKRSTSSMPARVLSWLLFAALPSLAACEEVETARYLRPVGTEYRLETTLRFENRNDGYTITSVTRRGTTTLTIASRFNDADELRFAKVTVASGDKEAVADARQENGKATITREKGKSTVLDCPAGVIVTSAPDWTDTVMLMQRYDAQRGGEQQFAGLWIHPVREPLRLTLRVRPLGEDFVTLDGKRMRLDRFQITLRNNSKYIGWRDQQQRLIRLLPAGKTQPAIVLAGWEQATANLKPQPN
ncbi:MAG: hypothetical protein IH991_12285 [Planctomycetes bacterium]|nr:hypothetical protein [Planctomycetota bacterium]